MLTLNCSKFDYFIISNASFIIPSTSLSDSIVSTPVSASAPLALHLAHLWFSRGAFKMAATCSRHLVEVAATATDLGAAAWHASLFGVIGASSLHGSKRIIPLNWIKNLGGDLEWVQIPKKRTCSFLESLLLVFSNLFVFLFFSLMLNKKSRYKRPSPSSFHASKLLI